MWKILMVVGILLIIPGLGGAGSSLACIGVISLMLSLLIYVRQDRMKKERQMERIALAVEGKDN